MSRGNRGIVVAVVCGVLLVFVAGWSAYRASAAVDARDAALRLAKRAEADRELAVGAQREIEKFVLASWRAAPIEAGRVFFTARGCTVCHTVDGRPWTGPSMKNVYGSTVELADGGTAVADEAYLEGHILGTNRRPIAGFPPMMPSFAGQIEAGPLRAITLYLMSLSAGHEAEAAGREREIQVERLRALEKTESGA